MYLNYSYLKKNKKMGRPLISRLVYGGLFIAGIALLIYAHVTYDKDKAMLGFLLLGLSLFFAHWPSKKT